jgi:serine/threonine protein kinase
VSLSPDLSASSSTRRKRLGEIAVEKGHITAAQLKDALAAQVELEKLGVPERIGTILCKKKLITKQVLQDLLREQSASVRRLGNFEIKEKIGQGAMGVVFRARQISMDRIVALKILSPKYSQDRSFIERFVREARAAGQFSHENIVTALDVGYVEPYYYIAMELVDGTTLRKILQDRGTFPESEALGIGLQVAKALNHALAKNIIHRDVKPDNIMVTPSGTAKLLDMGLACAVGAADESDEDEEESQSKGKEKPPKERKALGTPHYISPEAARGEENIDTRADIYSLGCTLYQLLTGTTPFEGSNGRAIMALHVTETIPDVRKKKPQISAGKTRRNATQIPRN